jgi:isohexenylglutaconyl-CoA hydratase
METAAERPLASEFSSGVLRLTLNRPQVANALNTAMVGQLRQALGNAEKSGEVRVIVLRGAGGNFCAGADIKDMASAMAGRKAGAADPVRELSVGFGRLCAAFAATPIAVIAIVDGAAMGGGFGLACAADVTIAAPDARFGLPETRRGLVPAQIAPMLIERLGYSRAKLLAVLGGNIRADDALRLGLVHEVAEDVDAALASALRSILECAPGALAATKKLLRDLRTREAGAAVDLAADVFVAAVNGAEGREGTAAFLARRPANWIEPVADGTDMKSGDA